MTAPGGLIRVRVAMWRSLWTSAMWWRMSFMTWGRMASGRTV